MGHEADGAVGALDVAGAVLAEQHTIPGSDADVHLIAHSHHRANLRVLHAGRAAGGGQDHAAGALLQGVLEVCGTSAVAAAGQFISLGLRGAAPAQQGA